MYTTLMVNIRILNNLVQNSKLHFVIYILLLMSRKKKYSLEKAISLKSYLPFKYISYFLIVTINSKAARNKLNLFLLLVRKIVVAVVKLFLREELI